MSTTQSVITLPDLFARILKYHDEFVSTSMNSSCETEMVGRVTVRKRGACVAVTSSDRAEIRNAKVGGC